MNVLFVPMAGMGAISHGLPLVALSKKLESTNIKTAFLIPQRLHQLFGMQKANVLDIPHTDLRTEMVAYHRFKPDVVVDDVSVSTAVATQLTGLPRVTILRMGSLPGTDAKENFTHSATQGIATLKETAMLGIPQPKTVLDLLKAKAFIIPGVPSVEVFPSALKDEKYFYSGSLLGSDMVLTDSYMPSSDFAPIDEFMARHKDRNLVLLTFGTVAEPPKEMSTAIYSLLRRDVPVLSTIPIDEIPPYYRDLFYFSRYLPFHRICSKASLMIHQCGSGTYQYPIQYGVPGITIATGYRDRDVVGERLQELGVSVHLDINVSMFQANFETAVNAYLDTNSPEAHRAKSVLTALKREADETASAFAFDKVLSSVRKV